MFHLLYHDGEGGHNLLVDGFHCAKVLKEKHPQSYKTLSEIGVPSHSAGDVATHIVPSPRRNPILNIDPNTQELVQIRFNNDDRSTLDHLEPDQVEAFYNALFDWNKIVTDEKNMLWTKFQPGRAVIFDNWRVLHGRSGFTGKRRLCGAYTNWDDYRSRWRTLNATPEQLNEGL
jgi:trimethyllysine dioxygenase